MVGLHYRYVFLNNKLLHGWHVHISVLKKFVEPTFLIVAQGLHSRNHVNIGEYIRAHKWKTCDMLFHKVFAYFYLTSPSYK